MKSYAGQVKLLTITLNISIDHGDSPLPDEKWTGYPDTRGI
ncbi:MAG: hypothetical protein R3C11_22615 [Planctomycetaceae bacterium]